MPAASSLWTVFNSSSFKASHRLSKTQLVLTRSRKGRFLGSGLRRGRFRFVGSCPQACGCRPGPGRGVVTAWLVRLRDGDSVSSFGAFWSTWNSASQGYPASKAASFFLRERACICAVGLAADLPNVSGVRFVRWRPWQPQRVEAWPWIGSRLDLSGCRTQVSCF